MTDTRYIAIVLLLLLLFLLPFIVKRVNILFLFRKTYKEIVPKGTPVNVKVDYRVIRYMRDAIFILYRFSKTDKDIQNIFSNIAAFMTQVKIKWDATPTNDDDPFSKTLPLVYSSKEPQIIMALLSILNRATIPMTDEEAEIFSGKYSCEDLLEESSEIPDESIRILNGFRRELEQALSAQKL